MDALQEKAIKVIKPLIPPDAEDRVARTVKQLNATVRDHIRAETGLRLSDNQTRSAIPVKVTEGFPAKLAGLIGHYDDPVLWRLIAAQPRLGGVVEGLQFLLEGWPAFEKWPALPPVAQGSQPALERARDVALALQQVAVSKQVKEELTAIHEDILGAYRFSTGSFSPGSSPWVEIYWMPLALIAAMLDVRIEDLTAVTLVHELAHGYTHLGRDIDGLCWEDNGFVQSELGVVEGLAQFYTDIVTGRMMARMPGAHDAYGKLLELQSGPYRLHEKWVKDAAGQRGETVRFVMLAARNRGAVKHAEWEGMLTETSTKLKRKGAATQK
jgi:predicted Zn-dependent protease with MMP-like domain